MLQEPRKFLSRIVLLSLAGTIQGCITFDFTQVRAQFLPPVNYTGSICRLSDPSLQAFLTPRVFASDTRLARKMAGLLAKTSRYYAFSIIDPVSGYYIRWNDELIFHGASTYKAAILLAIIKMEEEKKISLEDPVEVRNNFFSIVDHSGFAVEDDPDKHDDIFLKNGEMISLKELLNAMIIHSSNLATNLLIKQIGTDTINLTLSQIGSDIKVIRGVSDDLAYADCLNNTLSAKSLTLLYETIFNEKTFSRQSRETMMDILKKNDDTSRLPAKLPENTIVAHKPGETSKVLHDAGIVIPSGGNSPYFITVLTSEYKPGITKAIAEVSRLAYEAVIEARQKYQITP